MSDEESSADRQPPPAESPHERGEGESSPVGSRGVIPEIFDARGRARRREGARGAGQPEAFVHDLKVPKEIAHYLFQQIDETKNGLFRVVAKEMRDFLEHTNFAGEVQKLLTTVQFEVNTTIRFTPNDGRKPREEGRARSRATSER